MRMIRTDLIFFLKAAYFRVACFHKNISNGVAPVIIIRALVVIKLAPNDLVTCDRDVSIFPDARSFDFRVTSVSHSQFTQSKCRGTIPAACTCKSWGRKDAPS